MKTLALTATALMLLGAAPALAMSCCGSSKGKTAMCSTSSMAPNIKGKKGGCCCEKTSGNMSKRT
ncbi:hypothetical protein [Methylobacterium haplocladii]|uniref:Lipoprotein n=1 Tax=Methylobacterium haplocladii TaxID=1176176 RepID=A0A512IRU7_9HYPH|nr:hypothetical protein [Methylobacterium haplocladii]GEP00427.1 hypothetical protein MHA02_28140 [Methylobacterium haplocladii]GJD82552.1 hypothetical protein HPGCJGGD_0410 [Methylobacterium haplocladii]GLS59403.1 hypothetical protein GCM10007887_20690 [Methylobacterium haplocladii]